MHFDKHYQSLILNFDKYLMLKRAFNVEPTNEILSEIIVMLDDYIKSKIKN